MTKREELLQRATVAISWSFKGILSGSKKAGADKGKPLPRILPVEDHLIITRPKDG